MDGSRDTGGGTEDGDSSAKLGVARQWEVAREDATAMAGGKRDAGKARVE